ncbi:hypothetical protein TIFTF001_028803 [Ficus carica]|uniref:Uncharacterized protein n=1 Tax=Ficus carica TaxID=3494 RepID=A0AA88DQQ5_FICCA|nr:hypothetical protein TIFTF001_028803 [Ficus carica]
MSSSFVKHFVSFGIVFVSRASTSYNLAMEKRLTTEESRSLTAANQNEVKLRMARALQVELCRRLIRTTRSPCVGFASVLRQHLHLFRHLDFVYIMRVFGWLV